MITFKALAALLAYPQPELLAALPEIGAAIAGEGLLPRRERAAVASFLAELGEGDRLRASGALRRALRPHARPLPASFRARARRVP